jgi:uncharacterized protein (TIGR00369 family)
MFGKFKPYTLIGGLPRKWFIFLAQSISPYIRKLQAKIIKIGHESITMTIPYQSILHSNQSMKTNSSFHHGVIITMLDQCGGFAAWTQLTDPSMRISTANLRVDFLESNTPIHDIVYFDGVVQHLGPKIVKVDIECWNSTRTIKIAIGRGSFNIYLDKKSNIFEKSLQRLPSIFFHVVPFFMKYYYHYNTKFHSGSNSLPKKYEKNNVIRHNPDKDTDNIIKDIVDQENKSNIRDNLYGGMSEKEFRHDIECTADFIREVLPMTIESIQHGKLCLKLPLKYEYVGNPALPTLHGGIIGTLLDHCSSYSARSVITDVNLYTSTSDLRIDYLRIAPSRGDLYCDATVEHISRKIIRVDSICWDETRENKIAIGRATYNIFEKESTVNNN